ncbi:MAG: ParA family protein [Lachnospiraceae bacterium]|nr:ParA family protein [Lachnospiraceae bacterium]
MCKVIAVCGYKGGVAKTTSAVNIGIEMANMGKKVLLIDMDAQGDMTKSLGVDNPEKLEKTIAEAIAASAELDEDDPGPFNPDIWIMHNDEGVDFVPANNRLAAVEKQLVGEDGGDSILKIYVDSLRDDYDYIILDSKPAMVTLAANVLVAADTVIIPVLCEYLPLTDVDAAIRTINKIRQRRNHNLKIDGLFLTMVDDRTTLSKEIERGLNQCIEEKWKGKARLYKTRIPRSVRVAEAPLLGVSLYRHDPKGKAAQAYKALTKEVLAG